MQQQRPDNSGATLPQSAELFDFFVENIQDYAIFMTDAEGRVVSWNPSVERLLGYTESEIVGQSITIIFTPEDVATSAPVKEMEIASAKGCFEDKRWHQRKDGSRFWANAKVIPLKNDDGTVRGFAKLMRDDTAQKQSEEKLEQTNRRVENILESVTDAFFALDHDWRFTYLNRQSEPLLQRQREELLGKSIWDKFPEAVGTTFYRQYLKAVAEQAAVIFEEFYPPLNTWFEVRAYPSSEGLSVYFHNITERKQAETTLLEAKERYRALVEATATTVWHATPEGALSFVGDVWTEVSGQSIDEILKWGWLEAVHPDDREHTIKVWHEALLNKTLYTTEFRILTVNGLYRWFGVSAVPIFDTDGSVREWVGINTDIDEQRRLDLRNRFIIQLDEAVRPLETPEEITLTLARLLGEYLNVDRCAYAEVETDENHFVIPGDYTKDGTDSIIGRYLMSDFGAAVLRLMRENQPYVVDDVNTDAQVTEIDLAAYQLTDIQAVICVPLHKNNRFSACMAVHQKAPRRWLPEEVELVTFVANRFWESIERARIIKSLHESFIREQEARQTAEQANSLKDEFLATLSHELRTPLNAILGWSQMLQNRYLGENETKKALATIERSARAQNQLIDDLLDVSRIITGKLRLDVRGFNLSSIITAAVDAARPAAEAKNIRLQILLDPQAGPISGDPDRLQQVVWNLLSNAIKFTPKDGRIQLRLERVNSHVEIVVSDSGKGIEPEFLPHVFERFRQFDGSMTRRHGGLGLGLAIVRQLVELHGGSVSVESAGDGQGATFKISLPLLSVKKELTSDAPREHPKVETGGEGIVDYPPELSGLRVLLVDDEADSRDLLNIVLDLYGATVTTASSAAEAFETVKLEKFDAIVSDIGMPEEDGFSLIGRIRKLPDEQGGNVPAIALTAYARAEDRVQALRSGFQTHIAKPVEAAELIAVVANLVGRMRKSNVNDKEQT